MVHNFISNSNSFYKKYQDISSLDVVSRAKNNFSFSPVVDKEYFYVNLAWSKGSNRLYIDSDSLILFLVSGIFGQEVIRQDIE
jgi:hypothetical protein